MSTRNFYNKNASYIYMVKSEDEWSQYNICESVCERLKSKGWEPSGGYDRKADGEIFAEKTVRVRIGRYCYVNVCMLAIIRSGYFADANLEWTLEIDGKSYDKGEYDEVEAYDTLLDWFCPNTGFCKIQTKNLLRKINKAIDEMADELESVYEECSEPLVCIGVFSNGEALYQKASNPLGIRPAPKTV